MAGRDYLCRLFLVVWFVEGVVEAREIVHNVPSQTGLKKAKLDNKGRDYNSKNIDGRGIVVTYAFYIQGGPQKMQKLDEYPTTKSVNYGFIRA